MGYWSSKHFSRCKYGSSLLLDETPQSPAAQAKLAPIGVAQLRRISAPQLNSANLNSIFTQMPVISETSQCQARSNVSWRRRFTQ